jgi:hypothetical protein
MPSSVLALSSIVLAAASGAPEVKAQAIPALSRAPAVDGSSKDLAGALGLKPLGGDKARPGFVAKVGYRKDTVYVAVETTDEQPDPAETLLVSLHFPGAGTLAPGYGFHFGPDGLKSADEPTPKFSADALRVKAHASAKGMAVEMALPPTAMPRWPAFDPMVLDLCVTYRGATNCTDGSMAVPLKLPDDYRKGFKLKYPDKLEGIERHENGWVGFGTLHYPRWIEADQPLTSESLVAFVTDHPVDPQTAHVPLPDHLVAPDGRPIVALVTGDNPYAVEDQCDMTKELRLGLFEYQGRVAHRVLEWTAANCALGRTASISFEHDGSLSIGYTNGATTTFTWSTDHYEQTQLGMR